MHFVIFPLPQHVCASAVEQRTCLCPQCWTKPAQLQTCCHMALSADDRSGPQSLRRRWWWCWDPAHAQACKHIAGFKFPLKPGGSKYQAGLDPSGPLAARDQDNCVVKNKHLSEYGLGWRKMVTFWSLVFSVLHILPIVWSFVVCSVLSPNYSGLLIGDAKLCGICLLWKWSAKQSFCLGFEEPFSYSEGILHFGRN